MAGKMDKTSVVFGSSGKETLSKTKDMNAVKSIVKKLYGNVPADYGSANKLLQNLRKTHKDDSDVMDKAYCKVGLVKDNLTFRVKYLGKKKFEADSIIVKNVTKAQFNYAGSKSSIHFHQKWLKGAMAGGAFAQESFVKDLMKDFGEWEKGKKALKAVQQSDKDVSKFCREKRKAVAYLIAVAHNILNNANDGFAAIRKKERALGAPLPSMIEMASAIAKRAGEKKGKLDTLDGLYASLDPDVLTLTDKEFVKMIGT